MSFQPVDGDGDGPMGPPGLAGANGIDGKNGKDGAKGDAGPTGKNGLDGTSGRDGKDGKDGANGLPGNDGKNGSDGKTGADGKSGEKGKDGTIIAPELILPEPYLYRKNTENKLEIAKKDTASGTDRTVFVIGSLSTDHFDFWESMGGIRYQKPEKGEFNALRMSPSGDGLSVTVGNYLCEEGTIVATSRPGTTQLRLMDDDQSGKSGYVMEFGAGSPETSIASTEFQWLAECPRGVEFLMRILTVTLLKPCKDVAYNVTIRHPKTDELYYSMQNLEAWKVGEYDPKFRLTADMGEVALTPDIPMPLLREERLVVTLMVSQPIELKAYEDQKYGVLARSSVNCLFMERSTLIGCVKGMAESDIDPVRLLPATFVKEGEGKPLMLWTGDAMLNMETIGAPIDYPTLTNMLNNLDAKSVSPQFLDMPAFPDKFEDARLANIGRDIQFVDPETRLRYNPIVSSIVLTKGKDPIYGHPCYWYPHQADGIEPLGPLDMRPTVQSRWQIPSETPRAILSMTFVPDQELKQADLERLFITIEQGRNISELYTVYSGKMTGARIYQTDPWSWQVTFDFPTPAMITESERDAMLPILQMEVRDAEGNQIKTRLSKAGDWSWCSIVAAPLTKELVYHSGIKEDLFKGMPTQQYKVTGFLQSLVKGSHATGQIRWPEGVNSHSVIGVSVSIWGEGVPDPAVRTTERKELSTWNAVGAQTEFIPGIAKTGMPWIAIITVDNTWTE